ncbi:hypothetical protein ACFX2I_037196 [Malus domestica]|uniref:S-protein homolog n=1 Tax=Malus domestica TaxID=3750 RepID=A0A498JML4_MALDO|nr:hypothetical protein DVH24_009632 [Malus domestica]
MMKITLLVLLIFLSLLLLCSGNLEREVVITNYLGPGIVLRIRCQSGDDNLGLHDLMFMDSFSWKFKTNSLTTLFFCTMWWEDVSGSFEVYNALRDEKRCITHCWWNILQLAAFTYNEFNGAWDIGYEWQK